MFTFSSSIFFCRSANTCCNRPLLNATRASITRCAKAFANSVATRRSRSLTDNSNTPEVPNDVTVT